MVTDSLIAQVKRKLNITWDDEETNARVLDIIHSAVPDLIHKLGIVDTDFDFAVGGPENTLFLAYCLYEWNHSTNEFDLNYERMIAQVRARHEVANYLASEGSTNDKAEV